MAADARGPRAAAGATGATGRLTLGPVRCAGPTPGAAAFDRVAPRPARPVAGEVASPVPADAWVASS